MQGTALDNPERRISLGRKVFRGTLWTTASFVLVPLRTALDIVKTPFHILIVLIGNPIMYNYYNGHWPTLREIGPNLLKNTLQLTAFSVVSPVLAVRDAIKTGGKICNAHSTLEAINAAFHYDVFDMGEHFSEFSRGVYGYIRSLTFVNNNPANEANNGDEQQRNPNIEQGRDYTRIGVTNDLIAETNTNVPRQEEPEENRELIPQ